jgi:hypothetical protein
MTKGRKFTRPKETLAMRGMFGKVYLVKAKTKE